MHLLIIVVACATVFQAPVAAELSSSSCALLRTASSLTTIIPELAQLAMRSYRASSSASTDHHRQKRFLAEEPIGKASSSGNVKGTVVEQMIANTIRDVNFTSVAILILNNNESMSKIQRNVDTEAIIRMIIREIDYEKLGNGLLATMEAEFDLEHFIASLINATRLDTIHNELLTNGTLPGWLVKHLHPDLDTPTVQRMFLTLKNVTDRFVKVLSKSERYDTYLFNMITQQALTPLNNIIQGVKEDQPTTFDQLIEIVVNNINRVATEQFSSEAKQKTSKKNRKNPVTSTIAAVDLNNNEDVKLMLYQWSIAMNSMGQTVRVMLKSLEHLYCTSTWE